MMDELTGIIDVYYYYSESNGYSVIRLEDRTSVVGYLPKFNPGDEVEFIGSWTTHPKYGKQFKAEKFSLAQPTTPDGIIKYLSSGLIKGIGPSTAEKIVGKFGERTLKILQNDIDRLLEIEGIGTKKLDNIKLSWEDQRELSDVMLFLQSHNITAATAIKIYKTYKSNTIEIVKQNPYRLITDIWGVGFAKCDAIGKSFNFTDSHPFRIKAGIIFALNEIMNNGHTYVMISDLINHCAHKLRFDLAYNDPIFEQMLEDGDIHIEKDHIYLSHIYNAEREIENSILRFTDSPKDLIVAEEKALNSVVDYFSETQLEAIRSSLEHKLFILTGGPGTGKTTTVKGIVKIFIDQKKEVLLAAPTGRAAKRMNEIIGIEAKTIHRLLEFNPKENTFNINYENKLKADLLVIDELSMIDTLLMYHLITAIDENTTIVFVGDANQLPSVGAGNVLNDLIKSNKIPVISLTEIYRQAEESRIITAAHEIYKGIIPNLNEENKCDVIFHQIGEPVEITEKIIQLYVNDLPSSYSLDSVKDIQVISPMYRGDCGVNNLNTLLQKNINSNSVLYTSGEKRLRAGDKVMQLRNNYTKGVFNGDIGFIIDAKIKEQKMLIFFDNKPVEYDFSELDELTLAYSITVHKSQGSEYPCVVMPLTTSHYIMLQRNLLYTAITRAAKLLVIVGTRQALATAVRNNKTIQRNTSIFH